jgi:crossover junction endodeoxyribonuclease RuvC
MKIVGLDLSLTSTGVAVLLTNRGEESTRVIKSKKFGPERLAQIRNEIITEIIPCDFVVIENYSFGSRGRSIFSTGELGGVIRVLLWENKISYLEVAPSQVKKYCAGSGKAEKDQMIHHVYKRWGKECATSDEADAYTLAMIGVEWHCLDNSKLPKFQQEVLAELRKKYAEGEK